MINLKYALKQLCGDHTVKEETAAAKIFNNLSLLFDYKEVGIERVDNCTSLHHSLFVNSIN